jgi:DNA-binding response OmpR family regulator
MVRSGGSTGREFLSRKSELSKGRQGAPRFADVLIVEDNDDEAKHLHSALRAMFGYSVQLRRARTLGNAMDSVIERKPDIVFLDDNLKPNDTANTTIPYLQRFGYDGPIIIVSSMLDQFRRAELMRAGCADAIHKDHIDSVRLAEALARIEAKLAATATAGTVQPVAALPRAV